MDSRVHLGVLRGVLGTRTGAAPPGGGGCRKGVAKGDRVRGPKAPPGGGRPASRCPPGVHDLCTPAGRGTLRTTPHRNQYRHGCAAHVNHAPVSSACPARPHAPAVDRNVPVKRQRGGERRGHGPETERVPRSGDGESELLVQRSSRTCVLLTRSCNNERIPDPAQCPYPEHYQSAGRRLPGVGVFGSRTRLLAGQ